MQEFSAFHETQKFETPHYWTSSRASWIQSTLSQTATLTSILILSSHLRLDFPSFLFSLPC
jgi:hypothetical protein